jgi:hypothetical protein
MTVLIEVVNIFASLIFLSCESFIGHPCVSATIAGCGFVPCFKLALIPFIWTYNPVCLGLLCSNFVCSIIFPVNLKSVLFNGLSFLAYIPVTIIENLGSCCVLCPLFGGCGWCCSYLCGGTVCGSWESILLNLMSLSKQGVKMYALI